MPRQTSRRAFLQETAALGIGLWAAGGVQARQSVSPNERIRFACIGVDGKGKSDSGDAAANGDVVAICDIDDAILDKCASRNGFAQARRFNDYRRMFDEIEKNVDAVVVSTPDHNHACATAMALLRGKACFTQKPLTHTVYEARYLADLARRMDVPTQMGNQGTANDSLRRAAAVIRAGHVGTVKEVHVWTNRPVWAQGGERPEPEDETPPNVHWDLFIGPAPYRPYAPGYHQFAWRGWWDFGTGALGDMACHTFNMPYMALDLRNPTTIEARHSGHNKDSYPSWSVIQFQFPATGSRPAIPVTWYDGGQKPSKELFSGKEPSERGALIIGDKDTLHAKGDYCDEFVLLSGNEIPQVEYVKSPGHFAEFVESIRGGNRAVSNFSDYAGPLTETILLGNLAVWCGKSPNSDGKQVVWDSAALRATNASDLDSIVKTQYRDGWSLNM